MLPGVGGGGGGAETSRIIVTSKPDRVEVREVQLRCIRICIVPESAESGVGWFSLSFLHSAPSTAGNQTTPKPNVSICARQEPHFSADQTHGNPAGQDLHGFAQCFLNEGACFIDR